MSEADTETGPAINEQDGPIKKNRIVDDAVQKSGLKKRDVKLSLDALLEALGAHLVEGQTLNLPPLGKIKVAKVVDGPNGEVVTLKLRKSKVISAFEGDADAEGIADGDD
ncbi:HU family DNA-binding protein [Marivivens aquimaris]|uniref:HU family DNA-binding protein n=1 Tax=Marivivens aquimaris TaxID=2774876 RepID=UPI00187EFB42|nr:HU family DNA-binding protein [Marivivens aquimaris]